MGCSRAGLLTMGVVIGWTGCGERTRAPAETAPAAVTITQVDIDAANAPRDGGPLIAGEDVRIGVRFSGGRPPYRGLVTAVAQTTRQGAVAPIQATFAPAPNQTQIGAVEMAMRATIDARAHSGAYQLRVEVSDGDGGIAASTATQFTLIGEGAPTLTAVQVVRPIRDDSEPPSLEIIDAGGRRRAEFVRGETATIRATVPGAGPQLAFSLGDPKGHLLLRQVVTAKADLVEIPIAVPRLAAPGDYPVAVVGDPRGSEPRAALGKLRVGGVSFAPADRLAIDDLSLRGGADGRAARAGFLYRGERLNVEARTGGGQTKVVGVARLRDRAGQLSVQAALAEVEIKHPDPQSRTFVSGTLIIPTQLPVGRYRLEVEVTEGEDVSSRSREVFIE